MLIGAGVNVPKATAYLDQATIIEKWREKDEGIAVAELIAAVHYWKDESKDDQIYRSKQVEILNENGLETGWRDNENKG